MRIEEQILSVHFRATDCLDRALNHLQSYDSLTTDYRYVLRQIGQAVMYLRASTRLREERLIQLGEEQKNPTS